MDSLDPTTDETKIKIACVQMQPVIGRVEANVAHSIGLINRADVIDGTLVRVPKAYPAYFGTYGEFEKIRAYLDQFPNLYPIGRNGMHRYNNQDDSMLAANQCNRVR